MSEFHGDGARRDDLVLAVDGGGAKTDLALLDSSGTLLAHARGGRSQVYYLGVDGCIEVLESLLELATQRAGLDPRARPVAATARLLLAGIDLPEQLAALRSAMHEQRWSDDLVIGNDTEALLRAGSDRGWGVAVVCGTGINCIGLAQDGREARFLSFGSESGDWGGGGDVGLAALAAAVRAVDGRGPRSALESAVPAHFGLGDPFQVARAFHLEELAPARLGELAPIVFDLAEADAVAADILRRLVDEVVAFARAALQRLELMEADPDVVLGGRVLRTAPPRVAEEISQGVHAVAPRARVVVSPSDPIVGAALLGLDAIGASATARDRARTELDAAVAAGPAAETQRSSALRATASPARNSFRRDS